MRMVKVAVFLLVLAMLFTACSNANPTTTAPTVDSSTTTSTSEGNSTSETSQKLDISEHFTITASSPFFLETGVDYNDALTKEILKDYNASVNFVAVTLADMDSTNRIWISAGDMPDITFAGFNYSDYQQFADQGLVRALPADYEGKYPSLAKAMAASGFDVPLKERNNGIIYCAPKPIFVNKFVDPIPNHLSLYYRKDWAEQLNLPVKKEYSLDEVMQMAKAFMEQDPNGNGAGKTVGFACEPGNMIRFFCLPFNSAYYATHKVDGEYVFGPFEDSTLEGLKTLRKYYDEGIIYKDFFAIKARGEVEAMLNAGLTGMMYNGGAFGNVKRIFTAFESANPGASALDKLEMANIIGSGGKIHIDEMANLQSVSYFSPKMEDAKFDRILAILDHAATPEVQDLINMGFEGKDYTRSGDTITLTREKTETGDFKPMADLYPSYSLWSMMVIAWDDYTARDPSTNPDLLKKNTDMWKARGIDNSDMFRVDYDLRFYSSKPYDQAITVASNIGNDFTNIVITSADIEGNFKQYIETNNAIVQAMLDDVNTNVGK